MIIAILYMDGINIDCWLVNGRYIIFGFNNLRKAR